MGYDPDSELAAVTMTAGTSGFDGLTANQETKGSGQHITL
jgi:hypothetical protein